MSTKKSCRHRNHMMDKYVWPDKTDVVEMGPLEASSLGHCGSGIRKTEVILWRRELSYSSVSVSGS